MNTLRILIADDEAGMRHSIVRALRSHTVRLPDVDGEVGFDVAAVGSGEEAVQAIDERAPDLLLLDYKLGDMTGIEILEMLNRRNAEILTVMITAFATIETAVRATKCGAFDFLAKPFTPDELRETVRKAAKHILVQRRARQLAAEKHRVRFEFISVLAHELKSPLAAVETLFSILQNQTAGDNLNAYSDLINRCMARIEGMRKLIVDLLDLTRIESGEKRRDLVEMDVVASARTIVENNRLAATPRGIEICLSAPEALPFFADRGEIDIILNNLVSNAVKYNRDNGRVDVTIAPVDDTISVTVADTGIGLTTEEAARLFADFVRIKNDKTRGIPGSGLGLSIVKKIAGLYDGTATVTSEPGVGSTFRVVLKRTVPKANPADDPKRALSLAEAL